MEKVVVEDENEGLAMEKTEGRIDGNTRGVKETKKKNKIIHLPNMKLPSEIISAYVCKDPLPDDMNISQTLRSTLSRSNKHEAVEFEKIYTVKAGTDKFIIPKIGHALWKIYLWGNARETQKMRLMCADAISPWYSEHIKLAYFCVLPICMLKWQELSLQFDSKLEKDTDISVSFIVYRDPEIWFPLESQVVWNPNPILIQDGCATTIFPF